MITLLRFRRCGKSTYTSSFALSLPVQCDSGASHQCLCARRITAQFFKVGGVRESVWPSDRHCARREDFAGDHTHVNTQVQMHMYVYKGVGFVGVVRGVWGSGRTGLPPHGVDINLRPGRHGATKANNRCTLVLRHFVSELRGPGTPRFPLSFSTQARMHGVLPAQHVPGTAGERHVQANIRAGHTEGIQGPRRWTYEECSHARGPFGSALCS